MRSDFKNELAKKYGKLKVMELFSAGRTAKWKCICDCGKIAIIQGAHLRSGESSSCGCEKGNVTHGMTKTRIWQIFQGMKERCYNKNSPAYKNYGDRGIKCEWKTFENFFADMGNTYKNGFTIERIDNNGNYCEKNCKWATRKEQANNTRRNINIEYQGKIHTLSEWCEELKLNYWTIIRRIYRGWNKLDALLIPIKQGNYK